MYSFIVNPNSRSGKGAEIWKSLEVILRQRNVPYKAYFTEYRGHAAELAAKVCAEHASDQTVFPSDKSCYLIAVGGDGTIQEVLTGIRDLSAVYFGYIPTGSGNDFCRSMKIPQDSRAALEVILGRHRIMPMNVPLITCGERQSRFAISCGMGFDAAVCHEVGVTPMKNLLNKIGLGKLVYLFVALKQLLFLTPSPMTLKLDDQREFRFEKVYFTAVMNQKYEGGGFKFCPLASPSDGLLDIIVIDSLSKAMVLACLPTAFFGMHTRFEGIHIFHARTAAVYSPVTRAVHKDGENAGLHRSFTVRIEDLPVQIILPS